MDEVETRRRKIKDQEIVLAALRDACLILREHIEPGPRNCELTIHRLLQILDNEKVIAAINHLDRRYGMRLITET